MKGGTLAILVGIVLVVLVLAYSASTFLSPRRETATQQTRPELPAPFEVNPSWLGLQFEDVFTGDKFSVKDFTSQGKIVIVEFMAIWCPLCREQAKELRAVQSTLGDNVVIVSLDIDPNEKPEDLRRYAASVNGKWIWAMDEHGVGARYNAQAPDTPILFIDTQGNVFNTQPGIKRADFIVDFVRRLTS
jgi:thiol-disulfide isomerase/thioredoxin